MPKAQAYCVFLVGTRQKDVVLFIALSSIIFLNWFHMTVFIDSVFSHLGSLFFFFFFGDLDGDPLSFFISSLNCHSMHLLPRKCITGLYHDCSRSMMYSDGRLTSSPVTGLPFLEILKLLDSSSATKGCQIVTE